jgi:hypothetical protein
MKISSLNTALPSVLRYGAREVLTGRAKHPVGRATFAQRAERRHRREASERGAV